MKLDTFTISRFIFIIFIVIIGTYLVIENKKPIEKFVDPVVQPSGGTPASSANNPDRTANQPATSYPSSSAAPTNFNYQSPSSDVPGPVQPTPASALTNSITPEVPSTMTLSKTSAPTCSDGTCTNTIPIDSAVYLDSNDIQGIQNIITKIYQELYKANPSDREMTFYLEYTRSRRLTESDLNDVIATSAPTLRKTIQADSKNNTLLNIIGTEVEVIRGFEEILQRYPDKNEIIFFATKLRDDPTFNAEKLRQMLIASEEYQRLQKTQLNTAYVSLTGDITDRQLSMATYKLYNQVTGKEYLDEDTMKFLKKKYIEFNLNEATMRNFISNYMKFDPIASPTNISLYTSSNINASSNISQSNNVVTNSNVNVTSSNVAGSSNINTTGSNAAKEAFNSLSPQNPNSNIVNSLQNAAGQNVNTDAMINQIKNLCSVYDQNTDYAKLAQSQTVLANYINERNGQDFSSLCSRNKRFLNADDNMVLYPEFKWSVPQARPPVCVGGNTPVNPTIDQSALIGTLLSDSTETKVGNILPLFPPV